MYLIQKYLIVIHIILQNYIWLLFLQEDIRHHFNIKIYGYYFT